MKKIERHLGLVVVTMMLATFPACSQKDTRVGSVLVDTNVSSVMAGALPPSGFSKWSEGRAARSVEAPFRLTASDGTGLKLDGIDARAVVEGPLAFTELRLTFENPDDRVLEGRFQITLPTGAALSRFAMRNGDAWQEGEVVEKKRAREVYEDFLHRKQDPALLEQAAGNEFSARVFPIGARAKKEIILSYSHLVANTYALPLRGLPEVARLDVRVNDGKGALLGERHETKKAPSEDFVVRNDADTATAIRAKNRLVARLRPEIETAPDPITDTLVLVDTSASRAVQFNEQVDFVAALVRAIGDSYPEARVAVLAFDQSVERIYDGTAANFGEARAKLMARGALGASDLEGALNRAGVIAREGKYRRVLLISDGVATAGKLETKATKGAAHALADFGVERLDVISEGGIRDDEALRELATAGLPRDGIVVSRDEAPQTIGKKLAARTASFDVSVEGATWSYPKRVDGVQQGEEIQVFAEFPEDNQGDAAKIGPRVTLAGPRTVPQIFTPPSRTATSPLLERAIAKAKIESLTSLLATEKDKAERLRIEHAVLALSVEQRVLSPFTSLLVLESHADYERFGLPERSLANILTVDEGKIALASRNTSDSKKPGSEDPGEREARSVRKEPSKRINLGGQPGDPFSNGRGDSEEAVLPSSPRAERATARSRGAERVEMPRPMDMKGASNEPASLWGNGGEAAASEGFGSGHGRLAEQMQAAGGAATTSVRPSFRAPARARPSGDPFGGELDDAAPRVDPYSGRFAEIMRGLKGKTKEAAMAHAQVWHEESPGDVLALVALGEAYEATGAKERAARAYGSIIDLFSSRADLRRFAGERLERLADIDALSLATDTYEKAVADRPDHPSSHRLLAWSYARQENYERAFDTLEAALLRTFSRFEAADTILGEDLGMIARAWIAKTPSVRADVMKRLHAANVTLDSRPSLRFVLNWETDANDVDFHIRDDQGGHAYFQNRDLPSGGSLYADITTGYGPECFAIKKSHAERAKEYTIEAHYYSRGPMGYGMGKVQIIEHDGQGHLKIEDRPFVVMTDQAFVTLGKRHG